MTLTCELCETLLRTRGLNEPKDRLCDCKEEEEEITEARVFPVTLELLGEAKLPWEAPLSPSMEEGMVPLWTEALADAPLPQPSHSQGVREDASGRACPNIK